MRDISSPNIIISHTSLQVVSFCCSSKTISNVDTCDNGQDIIQPVNPSECSWEHLNTKPRLLPAFLAHGTKPPLPLFRVLGLS